MENAKTVIRMPYDKSPVCAEKHLVAEKALAGLQLSKGIRV
jgi:hypothetical protein